jgi:hypothetical protein
MLKLHSGKVNHTTLKTLARVPFYQIFAVSKHSTTRHQSRNFTFPSLALKNPFHEFAFSQWTGRLWGTASALVPQYYKQYQSRGDNENSEKAENVSWASLCVVGAGICACSAFHTVKKLNEEMKKSTLVGELTKAEEYLKKMVPPAESDDGNSEMIIQNWKQLFRLVFRVIELTFRFAPVILLYPVAVMSPRLMDIWYQLLLYTLRTCGPTFIKIGQWYYR